MQNTYEKAPLKVSSLGGAFSFMSLFGRFLNLRLSNFGLGQAKT